MSMSENINELMAALAKAQGKILHASKCNVNPHFRSKYADLASVWEACRSPLSENGLAVVQTISHTQSGIVLTTTLGHSSGQWIRSEMPIELIKKDPQTLGSVLTYYRRYSLAAIVGVAPDEDDDAEKAQAPYRSNAQAKPTVPAKLSASQLEELEELMGECDPKFQTWVMTAAKKNHNADSLADLPVESYEGLKRSLLANSSEYRKSRNEELAEVGGEK